MMVVITMTKCPPKLRGDLTRWMIEIDTGVYVGNLNHRVRDAVWDRVCQNIGDGRASMAYSTNGEQRLDFKIHNPALETKDYDGIRLVKKMFKIDDDADYRKQSNINKAHIIRTA